MRLSEDVHVWQHILGNACNAIFVLTLAGPLLQAERRMVARVQVQAALGRLSWGGMDSLKHRLTRRAVERREVNDGDVCPICHEELTDAEMGYSRVLSVGVWPSGGTTGGGSG